MSCFDNIVAVRGLCDEQTPQTFFLDDIGIDKGELGSYITKGYSGVQDLIDQKSAFAIRHIQNDIYSHLLPSFRADSILAGSRVGFEAKTKELINQSGFVGGEIQMHNPQSFVDFTISDVSLFTDFTGTIPILIYDLLQEKLLGTISCNSVAGEITTTYQSLTIPAPRKQLKLWMGYDATGINSYKTTSYSGCSNCSGNTFSNRFVKVTGAAAASPFTLGTITSLTHTAGISFNYSVRCNHYDWICSHRDMLSMPILYRTGLEIMNHAMLLASTQRTMNTTTVDKKLLGEKAAFYETNYTRIVDGILKSMRLPSDANCFHCNKSVTSIVSLPA